MTPAEARARRMLDLARAELEAATTPDGQPETFAHMSFLALAKRAGSDSDASVFLSSQIALGAHAVRGTRITAAKALVENWRLVVERLAGGA